MPPADFDSIRYVHKVFFVIESRCFALTPHTRFSITRISQCPTDLLLV